MFQIFHCLSNCHNSQLDFLGQSFTRLIIFSLVGLAMNTNAKLTEDSIQPTKILVNITKQKLFLYQGDKLVKSYPVSTAKKGVGNQKNSNKTPLGQHRIAKKFGDDAKLGEVFIGRQSQNRVTEIIEKPISSGKDYILTRILWLDGMEQGFNKGGNVDTKSRYIYIHGTNEEGLIGQRTSHGCIRMRNEDVIQLFELVSINSLVVIE